MFEIAELFPKLTRAQRETIARASTAFALWKGCPLGECRRAHACRGFAEPVPECAPALADRVREARDALLALLPKRPGDETSHRMRRVVQRVGALVERQVEELERKLARMHGAAGG
ncbi:MAG: hypothetical protein WD871_03375 [Xanthobacteraceae bacterium]